MTDDHPPSYDGPPGKRKPMWPGFLLGLFVVAPLLAFLTAAGPGFGALVIGAVIGSFVLLFLRDPFLKGIGAGVLTAGALAVLVLFVACYQYLQDSS